MKFNGIQVPVGEGIIVEVHADLIQPTADFLSFLKLQGFENDPFSVFYPKEYTHHLTGRLKVLQHGLQQTVTEVRKAVEEITKAAIDQAGLYMEVELVRDTRHFSLSKTQSNEFAPVLDGFSFLATGRYGEAKADVHVEFPFGQVSPEVRLYLEEKNFYWVQTPQTQYFGPEEIATLQTDTYHSGQEVYEELCQRPLPKCTGIHLEQKLGMIASKTDLPMPEVISVKKIR